MILSMSGCGYQFTVEGSGPVIGGGPVVTGTPVRLAVHTLKNNTFEPALEFKYTGYLRRALKSGGGAEIVEDEYLADYIMDGAILSVSFPSLAFSQTQTQESRVRVKVSVKVKERKTGEVRWSQTGTATAEFFVGATSTGAAETGLQFNRTLQDRAIEQAGVLVAVNLVDGFLAARDNGTFRNGDSTSDPATSLKGGNSKSSESLEPSNVSLPESERLH